MGILEQILAQVDNTKRIAAKNTKDFLANPSDFLSMVTGRVKEKTDKLAVKDPEILNELLENSIPGGAVGATVFHGTPHRFAPTAKNSLGEFLSKHIGTGEGYQIYGYGHYLAENKKVAEQYAKLGNRSEILGRASALERSLANPRLSSEQALKIRSELVELRNKAAKMPEGGTVYSVDLPDDAIARMLDWDKPLSQQSDSVIQGLINSKLAGPKHDWKNDTSSVSDFIRSLKPEDQLDLNTKGGLPGIKYLDQDSRAGPGNTQNFVVFDPSILKILGIE